jgi:exonuclease VII large subunit
MTKVMTLNGSRGAYDVHTPDKARKYLFPSVQEERETLRKRLETISEQRKPLKEQIKRDFPRITLSPSQLKKYHELGEETAQINNRLSELKEIVQQQTDENFETLFVRAAKNLLSEEQFQRIKDYTHVLMNELRETVYYDRD